MKLPSTIAAVLLGVLLATPALAQVGRPLPDASNVKKFTQTSARSFDDLVGRLVLVEFFAYW